jgi:hypothetical protein
VGPTHTLLSQNMSYLYSTHCSLSIYLISLSSKSRASTYYSRGPPAELSVLNLLQNDPLYLRVSRSQSKPYISLLSLTYYLKVTCLN